MKVCADCGRANKTVKNRHRSQHSITVVVPLCQVCLNHRNHRARLGNLPGRRQAKR